MHRHRVALAPALLLVLLATGCMPAPEAGDGDRFVRLDATGAALGAGATGHHCVLDTHSTLVWSTVGAVPAVLDPAHRYSWYSADPALGLGDPGQRDGGRCALERCDTEAALQAVNAAGLCGHSDWRIPVREEAIALGKRHAGIPLGLDPELFPGAGAGEFWTASTFRLHPPGAWAFDPATGLDRVDYKHTAKPLRLVRGTQVVGRQRSR